MDHEHHAASPRGAPRGRIALVVFLAIAAFFLVTEHRAHLYGWLPYLLILACPLMHLFHHRGHAHRDRPAGEDPPTAGRIEES